jgi:CubicO group peptidase (beta-lactamase class C family)
VDGRLVLQALEANISQGVLVMSVTRRSLIAGTASAVAIGSTPALLGVVDEASAQTSPGPTAQGSAPLPQGSVPASATLQDKLRFHMPPGLQMWLEGTSLERTRYELQHMEEYLYTSRVWRNPDSVLDLPAHSSASGLSEIMLKTRQGDLSLNDYVHNPSSEIDGIVVLHRGAISYEAYPRMNGRVPHACYSVTKTLTGNLIALMVDRELIRASDPIDLHLPELAGSGWQGVSIRDILDMASGINAVEEEETSMSDPDHPYYNYEASLGTIPEGHPLGDRTTYDVVASYSNRKAPGQDYEYTSVNSFVLGWLIEKVHNKPFSEVVSEEIWSKIGAEDLAAVYTSKRGASSADGGLICTLRDLARYGFAYTPEGGAGTAGGIVSDRYISEIRAGNERRFQETGRDLGDGWSLEDKPLFNSWHWDNVWSNGDFYKSGAYGQGLFVSPDRGVVVAHFGSPSGLESDTVNKYLQAVAAALDSQ